MSRSTILNLYWVVGHERRFVLDQYSCFQVLRTIFVQATVSMRTGSGRYKQLVVNIRGVDFRVVLRRLRF